MVESSHGRIQQNGWELTWQDLAQRLRAHKLQVVRAIQMIRATAILCSYMCSQNTEFYICHSAAVPSLTQQLQWSRWSLKWHIKWLTQQNEMWKPLPITRITHRNSHSSCFWWGDWTKWSMSFCMVAKTCHSQSTVCWQSDPLLSYLVARTVNCRQNDPHHQL